MGNAGAAPLIGDDQLADEAPTQVHGTSGAPVGRPDTPISCDARLTAEQNAAVIQLCATTRSLVDSVRALNDSMETISRHEAAVHRLAETFSRRR